MIVKKTYIYIYCFYSSDLEKKKIDFDKKNLKRKTQYRSLLVNIKNTFTISYFRSKKLELNFI